MVSILTALFLAKAPMGNSGFAADLVMQKPLESVATTGSRIRLDLVNTRDNTARACGRDRNGDEREAASRRCDLWGVGLERSRARVRCLLRGALGGQGAGNGMLAARDQAELTVNGN